MYITIPQRGTKILPALHVETIQVGSRDYLIEWDTHGNYILATTEPKEDKPGILVTINQDRVSVSPFITTQGVGYTRSILSTTNYNHSRSADLANADLKAVVDAAITAAKDALVAAPEESEQSVNIDNIF